MIIIIIICVFARRVSWMCSLQSLNGESTSLSSGLKNEVPHVCAVEVHSLLSVRLVISAETTHKTGEMTDRLSIRAVSTFSNPTAPRPLGWCLWNLACIFCGSGTKLIKLLASRSVNFGPCAAWGYPELSLVVNTTKSVTKHWIFTQKKYMLNAL